MLVSVMVLFTFSNGGYALNSNEDYNALHKLNKKDVFSCLIGYINTDDNQALFLKEVFQTTDKELGTAEEFQNDKLAENVLNYNLYNVKCILSDEQYKKYLVFINYYLKSDNLLSLSK